MARAWREKYKIFSKLEKHNHVKKHIRKLLISGSITSDPFGILNEQKRFYHSLYKSNVTDEDRENGNEFLSNLNIPRLSEERKQSCEGEIFVGEITAILNSFENNKSPGNDEMPIEFYKSCWELISDPFMECVRECFNHGEMSSSQRKAIITLIEKQHKDRTLIENWRPISLINVDAKIISKVICFKIKESSTSLSLSNEIFCCHFVLFLYWNSLLFAVQTVTNDEPEC